MTVHSGQGVICFTCPGTFVNYNVMLVCPVMSDSVPDSIQGDYRLYRSRALIYIGTVCLRARFNITLGYINIILHPGST